MSVKKRVAIVLLGVFIVLLNVVIIKYQPNYDREMITLQVTMDSDESKTVELFYLERGQILSEGFIQEQSVQKVYSTAGQKVMLTYDVPVDTAYIRIDPGNSELESESTIYSITVGYKKQQRIVQNTDLLCIEKKQNVDMDTSDGTIRIRTMAEDPYIVWNVTEWRFYDTIESSYKIWINILKIIVCCGIDVLTVIGIYNRKRVISVPSELWNNRRMIINLSKNDFKTKFAGSYLGVFWAFVQPVITTLLYWFVFEKGLHSQGVSRNGIDIPYVLWLMAGLVPWFFFQDAIIGGTNALLEYSYLVKKVVFKISILPIVKVFSALYVHIFFVAFTVLMYIFMGFWPDLYTLQVLYYSFCMILLVLGISYGTCALVVFFKDLAQIINIILQVLVWMTPIMWNIDGIELPAVVKTLFKLNPMYYIVAGYRDALIDKVWFWERPLMTVYFWMIAIVVFGMGMYLFRKLRVHFADVL